MAGLFPMRHAGSGNSQYAHTAERRPLDMNRVFTGSDAIGSAGWPPRGFAREAVGAAQRRGYSSLSLHHWSQEHEIQRLEAEARSRRRELEWSMPRVAAEIDQLGIKHEFAVQRASTGNRHAAAAVKEEQRMDHLESAMKRLEDFASNSSVGHGSGLSSQAVSLPAAPSPPQIQRLPAAMTEENGRALEEQLSALRERISDTKRSRGAAPVTEDESIAFIASVQRYQALELKWRLIEKQVREARQMDLSEQLLRSLDNLLSSATVELQQLRELIESPSLARSSPEAAAVQVVAASAPQNADGAAGHAREQAPVIRGREMVLESSRPRLPEQTHVSIQAVGATQRTSPNASSGDLQSASVASSPGVNAESPGREAARSMASSPGREVQRQILELGQRGSEQKQELQRQLQELRADADAKRSQIRLLEQEQRALKEQLHGAMVEAGANDARLLHANERLKKSEAREQVLVEKLVSASSLAASAAAKRSAQVQTLQVQLAQAEGELMALRTQQLEAAVEAELASIAPTLEEKGVNVSDNAVQCDFNAAAVAFPAPSDLEQVSSHLRSVRVRLLSGPSDPQHPWSLNSSSVAERFENCPIETHQNTYSPQDEDYHGSNERGRSPVRLPRLAAWLQEEAAEALMSSEHVRSTGESPEMAVGIAGELQGSMPSISLEECAPKVRLQGLFSKSAADGSLQAAMASTSLKARLQGIFSKSLADGSLQAAMASISLKARLQGIFSNSLVDSSLQAAMASTSLKARLQGIFSNSLADGSLQAAIASSFLQARLQGIFSNSLADGSLQAAIASSFLQVRLQGIFSESLADGSLQAAIASNALKAQLPPTMGTREQEPQTYTEEERSTCRPATALAPESPTSPQPVLEVVERGMAMKTEHHLPIPDHVHVRMSFSDRSSSPVCCGSFLGITARRMKSPGKDRKDTSLSPQHALAHPHAMDAVGISESLELKQDTAVPLIEESTKVVDEGAASPSRARVIPGAQLAGRKYDGGSLKLRRYERVVRAAERRHGPEHLHVAPPLEQLAEQYKHRERLDEHSAALERVLRIRLSSTASQEGMEVSSSASDDCAIAGSETPEVDCGLEKPAWHSLEDSSEEDALKLFSESAEDGSLQAHLRELFSKSAVDGSLQAAIASVSLKMHLRQRFSKSAVDGSLQAVIKADNEAAEADKMAAIAKGLSDAATAIAGSHPAAAAGLFLASSSVAGREERVLKSRLQELFSRSAEAGSLQATVASSAFNARLRELLSKSVSNGSLQAAIAAWSDNGVSQCQADPDRSGIAFRISSTPNRGPPSAFPDHDADSGDASAAKDSGFNPFAPEELLEVMLSPTIRATSKKAFASPPRRSSSPPPDHESDIGKDGEGKAASRRALSPPREQEQETGSSAPRSEPEDMFRAAPWPGASAASTFEEQHSWHANTGTAQWPKSTSMEVSGDQQAWGASGTSAGDENSDWPLFDSSSTPGFDNGGMPWPMDNPFASANEQSWVDPPMASETAVTAGWSTDPTFGEGTMQWPLDSSHSMLSAETRGVQQASGATAAQQAWSSDAVTGDASMAWSIGSQSATGTGPTISTSGEQWTADSSSSSDHTQVWGLQPSFTSVEESVRGSNVEEHAWSSGVVLGDGNTPWPANYPPSTDADEIWGTQASMDAAWQDTNDSKPDAAPWPSSGEWADNAAWPSAATPEQQLVAGWPADKIAAASDTNWASEVWAEVASLWS